MTKACGAPSDDLPLSLLPEAGFYNIPSEETGLCAWPAVKESNPPGPLPHCTAFKCGHNPSMTKTSKSVLWILVAAALTPGLLLYFACRDHSDYFKARKGHLSSAELSGYKSGRFLTRHNLSLKSDSGLKVECGLASPRKEIPLRRYPAVVLLAGLETGKDAVDYVRGIPDVIVAAIDYPYAPQDLDSTGKIVSEMESLREASLDTVPSVMLLLDYLSRRPDVDMSKVILAGFSMGAIFVPCISVEDRRPDVAVMVFGGGDLRRIIERNLRSFSGAFQSETLGMIAGLLLRPIEPMRYADRISPIPLLMINGGRDEMIPRHCTEEFFAKATPPKKIIWLDASHLTPGNLELTTKIVGILKNEAIKMKIIPPPQ